MVPPGGDGLLAPGLGDVGGGPTGLPHSASMEALMMPLPPLGLGQGTGLEGLSRPDSLMDLKLGGPMVGPDSRNTSAMLGGG